MTAIMKANMNRYKPYKTAAIFLSIEPLYQTGYWLGVFVYVDFICMDSFELRKTQNKRELQNEKINYLISIK